MRTKSQPPTEPARLTAYQRETIEARKVRRQIGRFRYWHARAEGGRARCCEVAIALCERRLAADLIGKGCAT
jgi:hypothetical protein